MKLLKSSWIKASVQNTQLQFFFTFIENIPGGQLVSYLESKIVVLLNMSSLLQPLGGTEVNFSKIQDCKKQE